MGLLVNGVDDVEFHHLVQTVYHSTIDELKAKDPASVDIPEVHDVTVEAILELAKAGQVDPRKLQTYAARKAYELIADKREDATMKRA